MLRGTDAVINLVAILHGSEAEFERVPRPPARRGSPPPARPPACGGSSTSAPLGAATDAPSRYLRSKARGEAALKAAPARPDDPAPFGHLRRSATASSTCSPGCSRCCRCCRWRAAKRASSRSGWKTSQARSSPRSTTRARSAPTIECCGPRVYTLAELARAAGRWSGSRAPGARRCPPPLGRLQAVFMELMPGTPLMSRDNLDSMRVANVASGKLPGLERLGIEPVAARSDRAALPRPRVGREAARSLAVAGPARLRLAPRSRRGDAPDASPRLPKRQAPAGRPRLASVDPNDWKSGQCSSTSATRTTRPGRCAPGC